MKQTVSFLKMKNPEKYKIGKYSTWYHLNDGVPVYCLPDVEEDGLKFAIHEHSTEFEKQFANEKEFVEKKMEQVRTYADKYFKGEY